MLREIKIENYKSILDDTIELGRTNVFIGANGSGKTNILEALAMVAASKDYDLNVEGLYNRGVRITKPSLTFSSFIGNKAKDRIKILLNVEMQEDQGEKSEGVNKQRVIMPLASEFFTNNKNDIYSKWNDKDRIEFESKISGPTFDDLIKTAMSDASIIRLVSNLLGESEENENQLEEDRKKHAEELTRIVNSILPKMKSDIVPIVNAETRSRWYRNVYDYQIYTLSTQALRGIISESKKQPLGINGEGLDILLANFDEAESERIQQYNYLISWLDELMLDKKDVLKYKGHKLGRSNSVLYFKDKFMRKNNNLFSAENANEGALHILFYLALFISKKTPQLFAIDNIETALNPRVCRTLVKELAQLARENNKQALITTHNPAILDGLNLNDDEQRLFVVYRTDEGHTKTKRIKLKPETKEGNLKLSELWMRGHLGGLPNDF